jgi:glycosyltransferase involved in cell wall biosynthesis
MMIYFSRKSESVKKTIAELKPDLLYVQQLYLGLIAYFTGFNPYIITFWGSDLYRDIQQFKNKSLIKKMLNAALLIHVVNKEHKEFLINEYSISESNIYVQHFGADIDRFLPTKDKDQIKEKLGFNEKNIILSARYAKDPDLFRLDIIAKAFKKLLDKYPKLDSRLIFANKAHLDVNLKNLIDELGIQEKVTFTGFLDGEKYQDLVKISDVLIQCPQYDSVGIALMEAMAAGVPVISTEVDGAKINLKDGYNGFFIEKRDPVLVMEKLSKILLDDELRKKLGKNANEWASKTCDRKIAMKNISNRLLKAISKP